VSEVSLEYDAVVQCLSRRADSQSAEPGIISAQVLILRADAGKSARPGGRPGRPRACARSARLSSSWGVSSPAEEVDNRLSLTLS